MAYGDFKEVQGVASGDGALDAKPTSTYVDKYKQNSTDAILSSDMYKKVTADIEEEKKSKDLTQKYVYNMGHSTTKEFENASSDEKRSMILSRRY